ncbi:hypothetical protein EV361DRAFT_906953 [Lentinula raphanica]|nr:hypothetical protein F5880DRAFT_933050 [Lentinula raphanica]KAJ3972201.1 hypothetical protein EV361DRAFT_906953 [Lentinula raphanica]
MIPDIPSNYPPARPDLKAFRPPKSQSKVAYLIWRVHMWIEGTFSLAMLEPWEKLLLCMSCHPLPQRVSEMQEVSNLILTPSIRRIVIIFLTTFILLTTGIVRYLPHHISVMKGRAMYYLWGSESQESPVLQWLGKNAGPSGGTSRIVLGEL